AAHPVAAQRPPVEARMSPLREQVPWRTAGFVVAVAAVILGAGAVSRSHDGRHPHAVPQGVALRAAPGRQIPVTAAEKEVRLRRTGDGKWSGGGAATETLMNSFADDLLPLRAFRRLPADLSAPDYGLAPPDITVTVQPAAGGGARQVALGAASFS